MPRVRITKVPLHWRNSWLVIRFMVPRSFASVSSVFQIPNNIFLRCRAVLEKGRKEREETTYWPRNQAPCVYLTHTTSQPSVEQVPLPTTVSL